MNEIPQSTRQLFPLRLTSMERFHLYDDDAANPNNFFGYFRFVGTLEPKKLEHAFLFAARVHPLFHCVLRKSGSSLQWQLIEKISIVHPTIENSELHKIQAIDITREVGCRVYITRLNEVSVEGKQNEFLLQFHHCVCDGAGAFQFLATAFQAYDNLIAGREIDDGVRLPDVRLLKSRGSLGLTSWRYLKHVWKMPVGLMGAIKFVFRKHTGLSHESPAPDWDGSLPIFIGDWLSAEHLSHWREQASQFGVTLNTILVSKIFRSIHEWNLENQPESASHAIRMVVPMNIRTVSDRWLPATNRSSIVQVDRKSSQFDNERTFLSQLDREIDVIRRWQLDKIFLIAIRGMSLFPAWLKSSVRNQKCRGAAIWTNVGKPLERSKGLNATGKFKMGKLELTELDVAGPVRPLTPVNFCVLEHHKKLRFSMYFDPQEFSLDSAKALYSIWSEKLRCTD